MAESLRYAVVIEQYAHNFGAYVPDLPGCGALGDTPEQTVANVRLAIETHLRAIRDDGDLIPVPTSTAANVEVAA